MNILKLRQQRAELIKQLNALVGKAVIEDRSLTEEEKREFAAIQAKIAAMDETITAAETAERLAAEAARPLVDDPATSSADPERRGAASVSERAAAEPGATFTRIVGALLQARGSRSTAIQVAETRAKTQPGFARVARALAAGTDTSGGFLVPVEESSEIIELLRPRSVVRRAGARQISLDAGNLTLPRITGGGSATYIGENTNIGKTEQTFGQVKLSAKKLAALVPISNDLIRFGAPDVVTMVRDDLVNAVSQAEDLNFIRSLGSEYSPRGLRYWAADANVLAVNATVNLANITADLDKAQRYIAEGNVRMIQMGWLMAPRTEYYLKSLRTTNGPYAFREEMDQGRLNGIPFYSTTQIPTNLAVTGTSESEVYLADFADVVIGDVPGLIIDVSNTAAYHDGSAVQSSFSLDQTVVRIIAQHDLVVRHRESVVVFKDVDWA